MGIVIATDILASISVSHLNLHDDVKLFLLMLKEKLV